MFTEPVTFNFAGAALGFAAERLTPCVLESWFAHRSGPLGP
jgi:hypothetical protein